MWQRLLVATGGSPWSEAAGTYATALAADTAAELCFLTVLGAPKGVFSLDLGACMLSQLMEHVEQEGKERLVRATARAMRAGVTSTAIVKWGHAPAAILTTAAEEDCDVIILGSRHLAGWKRLKIGSVANAVVAKAPQPVLVVKQASPDTPVSPRWRRLLVATGGSSWSEAAVDYAFKLAHKQRLAVCVLHVVSSVSGKKNRPAMVEGKNLLTRAEMQAAALGVAFEGLLVPGNIPEAILTVAARIQCDLIILGTRGLAGWKRLMVGSIANAVMAKSVSPVLIVKHFDTV